jgi:hypothetical protein
MFAPLLTIRQACPATPLLTRLRFQLLSHLLSGAHADPLSRCIV